MFYLVLFLFVGCSNLPAADSLSGKPYKLDFVIKEIEGGKLIDSHTYSMRAETGQPDNVGSIRTGSKVPSYSNTGGGSYSYIEVGVNIDVRRFREADGVVYLGVSAEVSRLLESSSEKGNPPIIRQNRWNSMVSAKIGQATAIFSSDDVASKRQMVVEINVTPVR